MTETTERPNDLFIMVHKTDGRPFYIHKDLIGVIDTDVLKNTCIHTILLADGIIKVKETAEEIIKML